MSQQITGNLTSLNANVLVQTDVATLPSVGSVGVQIGGNFTATLSFQATFDQVNWFSVNATPITAAGGSPVASTTAGGQFAISVFGFAQVRVIATAYSAGTAIVSLDTGIAAVPTTPLVTVSTSGDSNGGPPLASGLPSLAPGDTDKNFQGSDSWQGIVTAVPGQSFITFLDNPWIQGLTVGQPILLSGAPNAPAIEEVIVSTNNIPSVGTGTFVVNILNPVVNQNLTYATFDIFGVDGPTTIGINPSAPGLSVPGQTVVGVKGWLHYMYNPRASDPKRPIVPAIMAVGNPGVQAVQNVPDLMGANDLTYLRFFMEQMLIEMRNISWLLSQMKDSGPMDVPATIIDPRTSLQ